MTNERAIEVMKKGLRCMMTDPRDCPSRCDDCECNVSVEDGREAMLMAFKALEGKDTNVPTLEWLMQKADEWGMVYGKQFLILAQSAWKEGEKERK